MGKHRKMEKYLGASNRESTTTHYDCGSVVLTAAGHWQLMAR